jgi:Na+-driven multidrug efflux pump
MTYLSMLAVSVVIFTAVRYILLIYHLTPETYDLATEIIRYHALMATLIWTPSFALPNTLRAAGDVVYPMVTSIISMWVCRIGFAYLFTYLGMGVMGVWVAMTLDWALRAVLYIVRYKKEKWKRHLL